MGNACGGSSGNTKSQKSLKFRDEKKPTQQAKIVLLGNIAVGNKSIHLQYEIEEQLDYLQGSIQYSFKEKLPLHRDSNKEYLIQLIKLHLELPTSKKIYNFKTTQYSLFTFGIQQETKDIVRIICLNSQLMKIILLYDRFYTFIVNQLFTTLYLLLPNRYYRDSQAAILVYDVTDSESFNSLQVWINELEDKAKTEGMIIALVGNKIDSPYEQIKVTTQKAEQFAREKNFLFTECSAKTGDGIDRIFNLIIDEYIKRKNKNNNY